MRKLWDQVWNEIQEDAAISSEQKAKYESYRAMIVPILTGSVGRREVVLGSDLDYLLLVDDETNPLEDEAGLKNFHSVNLKSRHLPLVLTVFLFRQKNTT